jgi:hypothetical protein
MALLCKNSACKQPIRGGDLGALYNRVVHNKNDYSSTVKAALQTYGSERVVSIQIQRTPIIGSGVLDKLGVLSAKAYDTLFHLLMVLTLESGAQLAVEKTSVISVTKHEPRAGAEIKNVKNVPPETTLAGLFANGRKKLGEKNWFRYDSIKNNCQAFIWATLSGSGFGNGVKSFIKQDVTQLLGRVARLGLNNVTGAIGAFATLKD